MIETQCPNLKALDGDIVTQKAGAQEMPQAATWSQLQEELERIIPRFSSDSEALPAFTSNLIKRLKTAKWTAEENAVWDEPGRVRGASLKNTRRPRRVSLQEKT